MHYAPTDQEMEDLYSELERNFFQSISRGFIKLKLVQSAEIQIFLPHSMK